MPGQLELYNGDDSIARITARLTKLGCRLCAVHLSDSLYCSDAGKFVAVILSALSIMINLELSQLNVLSKADLMPADLPYELDFFQQLPSLDRLIDLIDVSFVLWSIFSLPRRSTFLQEHPFLVNYKTFCARLCEVVDEYNLVNFHLLDVTSKERMLVLLQAADQANGFAFCSFDNLRDIITT